VWQSLFDELKDRDFIVLAVALDEPEAARPWIEAAKPAYPCLIDRTHHVADLFNLVNVPQAVWIDEGGRIVRPPEIAGSNDGFRRVDRTTGVVPEEVLEDRQRVKAQYMDAVRDWVLRGAASANALDATQAATRLALPQAEQAEAHARFRLGVHLLQEGQSEEAATHLAEAARLHPASWAIWRRAAQKDHRGLASGPAFWARVDALRERRYYEPAQIVERTESSS